jgi:hypothetical protein
MTVKKAADVFIIYYYNQQTHNQYHKVYRVSQKECAKLRESVPYIKVYRYNPKHLYPKLNGYGDNGQRKVCGLLAVPRTVPAQLTALLVHCACPSLRVALLRTSDCVMNG